MKYSVYKTEDSGPAFGLVVGVFKSKTNRNNCALRTLEVCARYKAKYGNRLFCGSIN
ncbi:hypothetical protein DPMN_107726 [Dreissena polymorpha]|uniref:Uncharacterized protein n=1 Tax=Dreissena polymorpha TaxID=45954 RepID=A0A9D4K7P5_DREPO|nr:hypothetical protein DPMN_107726 [Dreissena polymorpha]